MVLEKISGVQPDRDKDRSRDRVWDVGRETKRAKQVRVQIGTLVGSGLKIEIISDPCSKIRNLGLGSIASDGIRIQGPE